MKLYFTDEDSERANEEWGANCGPHSIAAALGLSLDVARTLMPDFEGKGYTNPTMVRGALERAGIKYLLLKGLHSEDLCEGINRVQWEGPWLKPGVPPGAAYWHTHLVASANGYVFCTCMPERLWYPVRRWKHALELLCLREKYIGWHITHHFQFEVLAK